VQKFSLDLYLTRGSVYETGKREALVIQKVGTNAADPASPAHLRIDDKPLGKLTQDLSPLHKIMTFLRGTYSHGTDVALAADAEVEVISYTPKTIEKIVCNGLVMAKVANYTESEQDLAIRFFLEGAPLDFILEKTKTGGIDFMSARYPPNETEEHEAFSLAETPIEVPGDHTLSVKARNISGGAISPSAGTSLDFDIAAIIEYQTGV